MRKGFVVFRRAFMSESRSYEEAVKKLYALTSNAATIEQWKNERLTNKQVDLRGEMLHHLRVLDVDVDRLSVVHVAGTKGKGSVCQFVESVVRHEKPHFKTGTFISPHLIEPRERIRLQGKPVSRDLFAQYFWLTYDRLSQAPQEGSFVKVPPFFRFLNCMSFLLFQQEKVDLCVVEVGVGGRTCSTNVVSPVACGITRLGYDHMDVLGPTLTHIAFEKAGIMKPGVVCFSEPQQDEPTAELKKQASLRPSHLEFTDAVAPDVKLGLEGEFQRYNAQLGLFLARYWIRYHADSNNAVSLDTLAQRSKEVMQAPLTEGERKGLLDAKWRGRAQRIPLVFEGDVCRQSENGSSSQVVAYVDGAHTAESCQLALNWFESESSQNATGARRVLICNFKPNKQVDDMLQVLSKSKWDLVVFTPSAVSGPQDCSWQRGLQERWPLVKKDNCVVSNDLTDALQRTKSLNGQSTQVFITGSLYLAGATLELLKWPADDL